MKNKLSQKSEKNFDYIMRAAVEKDYDDLADELDKVMEENPQKATPDQMEAFEKSLEEAFQKDKNKQRRHRKVKRVLLIAAVASAIMAIIATVVIASRGGIGPYIFKETTSEGQAIWMTQDPTQEDFQNGFRVN